MNDLELAKKIYQTSHLTGEFKGIELHSLFTISDLKKLAWVIK